MKKSGQITVFLSLIFVCLASLLCALTESARTAGARWYLQMAADSSVDSLMSGYHRELWQDYRLLMLEYELTDDMKGIYETYLNTYLEADNLYPAKLGQSTITGMKNITDDGGLYFEKEILDYMQYGIWELAFKEDDLTKLSENLKEADALKDISDIYEGHSKDIARLENLLESISKSQQKQSEYYEKALDGLESYSGYRFRREVSKIKSEISKLPGLVNKYKSLADTLLVKLQESKKKYEGKKDNLSISILSAIESELDEYEEYLSIDGARRLEIEGLIPISENNSILIKDTLDQVESVEETIASWDSDENHDESDLWNPVIRAWKGFEKHTVSFNCGIADKEKQGFLENIRTFTDLDLLKLVLPENKEVSKGIVSLTAAPSLTQTKRNGKNYIGFMDNMLVNEYTGMFFLNFLSEEQREVQYETEYIISGKTTDRNNLESTILKIIGIREGLNMVHILSDTQKRNEARALAALIAGAGTAAPLIPVLQFLIMTVWALGEAIMDVKCLLAGEKVPLFKTAGNWKLDLDGLLDMGKTNTTGSAQTSKEGFGYETYLKLMMFMMNTEDKYFRMMDIIQMNIGRKQSGFLMSHGLYAIEIESEFIAKHVFLSLGISGGPRTIGMNYSLKCKRHKTY